LGIALFGSLGAAVYRFQMADALPPGISHQAAAAARESIAGAVSSPADLGSPLGSEVLDAARDAFTTAVNIAAGVGAVLFVALAVLAAIVLRRTGSRRGVTPSHSGT
jgi:DHA2 family multidrug resistance protein-like MFS transporter